MKKAQYSFSDDDVKLYFNLDSVLVNGIFYAAHRVYGLNFRERTDLPTYHKDMKSWMCLTKMASSWSLPIATTRCPTGVVRLDECVFLKQSGMTASSCPLYNVCNYAKAPEGQPTPSRG